ncbi:MAG TPA: carboxypeptidase-like regulatory domain-containing protein [Terriglobales bacterium]|nr:carboxypeptidase-like regulatory domain-containing protein [Terriglobales bacterium]
MSGLGHWCRTFAFLLVFAVFLPVLLLGQGADSALVRIYVIDPTGATIPNASATLTDEGTGVVFTCNTDSNGSCNLNALKPSSYTAKVTATSFKTSVREHVVLHVGQAIDLNFALQVGSEATSVTVEAGAPQVNTVNSELGTTVNGNYILNMPLFDRNPNALIFLAPGVTNVNGGDNNALGGLNFSSNGQRTFSAELRLDGAVASNPEGGEGGTNNATYKPSVEGIQEFKLLNNGYSAEYGSNGGTVISMITKSGTNELHGSGFYFTRRPWMDANSYSASQAGEPRQVYKREEYGGAIGGPIVKKKAFFFFDYEHDQFDQPFTISAIVPTALERTGDFSQSANAIDGSQVAIFDPFGAIVGGNRTPFPGNVIPDGEINQLSRTLINLFPLPNRVVDPTSGEANYVANYVNNVPGWQLDGKIDYYFNDHNFLTGRYYMRREKTKSPNPFLSESVTEGKTEGITLSDNWTLNPSLIWVNRLTLTRFNTPESVNLTLDPTNINGSGIGFPADLVDNVFYHAPAFPSIAFEDNYQGLNVDSCCTVTKETDTQWSFSSQMTKNIRNHIIKFGGERRIFLNNFFQPSNTAGGFTFGQNETAQSVQGGSDGDGNDLASFLLNFPETGTVLSEVPAVANKSMETSFFVQDEWRVKPRLSLSLGLRYEWSTPYTERFNRNQFTCFTCDSGINVPALGEWQGGELFGTTIFATSKRRHSDGDYNNIGPRLGFAYSLNDKTVIRGGAGLYYGLNFATNWQFGGQDWNNEAPFTNSLDGGFTRYADMTNPFPAGLSLPQEGKYGPLAQFGLANFNHAGLSVRNAEIYQWNIGVQHQFGRSFLVEANYSANRSTHLPWDKTLRSQDFVSAADRAPGTAYLNTLVDNPFQYLFVQVPGQPAPIFNEPTSIYNQALIPRSILLEPYPQFQALYGYTPFTATSLYNSLQVRFEKRYSHGLNFTGNYTHSHQTSDSDSGANPGLGSSLGTFGAVQDKSNLKAERSISANDTPNRFVIAATYEIPLGRGRAFGKGMNRGVDAVFGGWQVGTFVTFQSGQPLAIRMSRNRIISGAQRPDLVGDPCTGLSPSDVVHGKGAYLNWDSFKDPGDQIAGDTPRYISGCRTDAIRNLDMNVSKKFQFRENVSLELRGEFFNTFNHPNFGAPLTRFNPNGQGSFGQFTADGQPNNQWRHGQLGVRLEF